MPDIMAFTVLQICAETETDWFITTVHSHEQNGCSPHHTHSLNSYLQLDFPKMKLNLKGKIRNDDLEIQQNSQHARTRIMKKELQIFFQYCKTVGQYINSTAGLRSHDAKFGHLHKYLFTMTFL